MDTNLLHAHTLFRCCWNCMTGSKIEFPSCLFLILKLCMFSTSQKIQQTMQHLWSSLTWMIFSALIGQLITLSLSEKKSRTTVGHDDGKSLLFCCVEESKNEWTIWRICKNIYTSMCYIFYKSHKIFDNLFYCRCLQHQKITVLIFYRILIMDALTIHNKI